MKAFLKPLTGQEKPHRSGYYRRGLNTQYGRIQDLAVPKLRQRNREREWQILQRYERSLGNLLDWMCCLYVMGLSSRDLQEALYFILGKVLSVSAVNQITLKVQNQLEARRQKPLSRTPEMILVDGVWVDIQYTILRQIQGRPIRTHKAMSAGRRTCSASGDGGVGGWLPRTDSLRSCRS